MVDLELNAVLTAKSEAASNWLEDLGKTAQDNLHVFDNMNNMMNSAFSIITKMGIGAVASMTALAFTSPTVSAEFAKMKKPLFEISETLGQALQPGLQSLGGLLESTAVWLQENTWFTEGLSGAFRATVESLTILLSKLSELGSIYLKPIIEWAMEVKLGDVAKSLFETFGATIIGGLLGFKIAGIPGGILGMIGGSVIDSRNEADRLGMSDWTDQDIIDYAQGRIHSPSRGGAGATSINVYINGEIVNSDSLEVSTG